MIEGNHTAEAGSRRWTRLIGASASCRIQSPSLANSVSRRSRRSWRFARAGGGQDASSPSSWPSRCERPAFAWAVATKGRLDWEGIADEALVLLFNRAHTIESAPKNWLWGVVKRLIREEVRKHWPELIASEVSEYEQARVPVRRPDGRG